jgi:dihydrofolate reductase/dihydrofolate reductase (trimethoprim resistance protein)
MIISIIAAVAKNGVIGINGTMPWHIPGELTRFKELTWGKSVIMGRITYEDLGRPLPGRRIVVVSRSKTYSAPGLITCRSVEEAIERCRREREDEVFIAGGGDVYRQTIDLTDIFYMTIVDEEIEGDVYFPDVDWSTYDLIYKEEREGPPRYTYYTYKRKQAGK